ncbi:hypothetical protein OH77DRAFT_1429300 [Trametes cingulata]|nr:hypothetical protein OH77DRAFT_1429300 [Trametes cingulata]
MSLASSTPGSVVASLQAASRASQSSALVSDVLEFSGLSSESFPLSFRPFVNCVRQLSGAGNLLVSCFEIYKDTSPSSAVVKATMGVLGHQFNVATVLLPSGRKTHIRADFWAEPPRCASSRLALVFNDDHAALTTDGHLISRIGDPIAPQPAQEERGPTLESLACLFGVADKRLGSTPYDLFGRNYFWMTDMLFYAMARRYSAHCLAGTRTPEAPLSEYLRGRAGARRLSRARRRTRRRRGGRV